MKTRFLLLLFTSLQLVSINSFSQDSNADNDPESHIYNATHELKVYRFLPEGFDSSKSYPTVIIFHGGGWYMGEAAWGFGTAKHFASKGMIAFSAQYRLQSDSGNTPYESVLDAQTAIRWLRENSQTLNVDPERIAAYGWSAGGHIAACAAVFENLNTPEVLESSKPNLLAMKSPAATLLVYSDFQKRLGDKIATSDISPAEKIGPNMPPTIIVTGREDTVTPLAGIETYHNNMLHHGNVSELHVYDDVGHLFTPASEPDDGWPNPDKEVSEMAWKAIDTFFEEHGYYSK